MQPYHTQATINREGQIVVALPFPVGKKVDIVVVPSEEESDDKAWKDLAAREFLRGYTDEDGAYDNYKL